MDELTDPQIHSSFFNNNKETMSPASKSDSKSQNKIVYQKSNYIDKADASRQGDDENDVTPLSNDKSNELKKNYS